MRPSTQLSRAAMLACLQAYGREHLDACALALGYVPREAATITPPEQPVQESPQPPVPSIVMGSAVTRETPSQARFARVVAQRPLAATEAVREVPLWFQNAVPYDTDIRSNPALHPPPQPPLLPWSRLWPFLRLVLGVLARTPRPDIPRVVHLLARGQHLRQVPRLQRQRWAPTCQVVLDYAPPLRPFWSDSNGLHVRLRQLRGGQGLRIVALLDGELGGRYAVPTPQGWQEIERYPLPGPDTPVLVLSDLDCLGTVRTCGDASGDAWDGAYGALVVSQWRSCRARRAGGTTS
jgi:hypothetical protein